MKFAIVDLGSNTIRLSVYNTLPEGGFDLLFSEKEMADWSATSTEGCSLRRESSGPAGPSGTFRRCCGSLIWTPPHVFATASCGTSATRRRQWSRFGRPPAWGGCDLRRAGGQTGLLRRPDGHGLAGRRHVRHWRRRQRSWRSGPGRSKKAQSLPIGSLELFNRRVDGLWPKKRSWSGSAAPWPRP